MLVSLGVAAVRGDGQKNRVAVDTNALLAEIVGKGLPFFHILQAIMPDRQLYTVNYTGRGH